MQPQFLHIFFVLISFGISLSRGCGVTTHNVIAHRAAYWFLSNEYPEYATYIQNHQDAFQAGAAFPDWGYACPLGIVLSQLPNASETAHWPPFQKFFSRYIRETYPEPYSETGEKLVAFLLGLTSHAIADILWHDLRVNVGNTYQGFIQTMADVDYLGDYSAAHGEADTGGEFMAAYEVDLSFLNLGWYIPSSDLSVIYTRMGFTEVDSATIDSCAALLYTEVQAIKRLPSELLYPLFADKSPFLVDQYQDWWIGGINDMAVWTSWCWPNIIDWLENGVNNKECLIEQNDTYPGLTIHRTQRRQALAENLRPYSDKYRDAVKFIKTEDGNTVITMDEDQDIKLSATPKSIKDTTCISQTGTPNTLTIVTDEEYSLLGRSLAVGDFNNDGLDDVVIGAPGAGETGNPQAGAVYIVYGSRDVSGHESLIVGQGHYKNATSIFGTTAHNRFGWAIGSVDFNLDGFLDLVVSQPGTLADLLMYSGQVLVFLGSAQGITKDTPDIIIQSDEPYSNIAMSIQSGDVSGDGFDDLIIGAPYGLKGQNGSRVECGEVWVFYSSKHRKTGQILLKSESNVVLTGVGAYDWFGYHMEVVTSDSLGNSYLIVGAPEHNNGSANVGRLYAFDLTLVGKSHAHSLPRAPVNLPLKWTITGVDVRGHLGQSFAIGNPTGNSSNSVYVALGIPTKNIPGAHWYDENKSQAGSVIVFAVDQLNGDYTINQITPTAVIDSDEEFSRLGSVVGFSPIKGSDGSQTMWISEPYRDYDLLPSNGDSGAAYLWVGGSGFPNGVNSNAQASSTVCIQSDVGKSLYGSAVQMLDFNGDGIQDIVLGGPRDRSYVNNGGSATIMLGVF